MIVTICTNAGRREVEGESLAKIAAHEYGVGVQLTPVIGHPNPRVLWAVLGDNGQAVAVIEMPEGGGSCDQATG